MPVSLFSSAIHSDLFSDCEIASLLDEASDVAKMIRFEQALATAQGHLGVIPQDAARKISAALEAANVDPSSLAQGTRSAGVPVPALIAALRKQIGDRGTWLHWGATSQDVLDTAQVLQARECLDVLARRLTDLIDSLQSQSSRFAEQLLAGRTRSQIATPITLGYRIAQWAHPLIEAEAGLPDLRKAVLQVQFGGASGVNSALGADGPAVQAKLAELLELESSPSWHISRTSVLRLASWLMEVCAGLSKMAGDLILLGRSDIGEVGSGTGGGSSTMPQKANPVQAETIRALHQIAIAAQAGLAAAADPLEERDGAKWPLEWHFLPQLLLCAGTALRHAQALSESLHPNEDRIASVFAANPEIMAEAASFALTKAGVSRAEAKELVAAAVSVEAPFGEALEKLSPVALDWRTVLDPKTAIGPCKAMSMQVFAKRAG